MAEKATYQVHLKTPRGDFKSRGLDGKEFDGFIGNVEQSLLSSENGIFKFPDEEGDIIIISYEIMRQSVFIGVEF